MKSFPVFGLMDGGMLTMPINDYTDEELFELQYSDKYMEWLMQNAMDYGIVVCNGDTLLEAAERGIGFDKFLTEIGGMK